MDDRSQEAKARDLEMMVFGGVGDVPEAVFDTEGHGQTEQRTTSKAILDRKPEQDQNGRIFLRVRVDLETGKVTEEQFKLDSAGTR